MKYIKEPAKKFSQGYCVVCSGNCVNRNLLKLDIKNLK